MTQPTDNPGAANQPLRVDAAREQLAGGYPAWPGGEPPVPMPVYDGNAAEEQRQRTTRTLAAGLLDHVPRPTVPEAALYLCGCGLATPLTREQWAMHAAGGQLAKAQVL